VEKKKQEERPDCMLCRGRRVFPGRSERKKQEQRKAGIQEKKMDNISLPHPELTQ
jgi:hypothetical protein